MRIHVTRSGTHTSKRFLFLMSVLLSVSLAFSLSAIPASALEAEAEESSESAEEDGPLERPDRVSAAVTARIKGKRVEILSERSETTRTFVNADGSFTTEQFGSPVRVQENDGKWVDVDYDLEELSNGSFAPKAAPLKVAVGGGDSTTAAAVDLGDDESLKVTWAEELPEPTIEGGVATYELSESMDLIVAVTSDGVATRIRLNEQPTEADLELLKLGLREDGVSVAQTGDGLKMVDADGKKIGQTATLVAWDSQLDAAGDPVNVVPVPADLEAVSGSGLFERHELSLSPPEDFLTDPTTEYPVIVDPDISSLTRLRDTYVRNGATSQATVPRLQVGRIYDNIDNTNPAQAYLKFSTLAIEGKSVLSAEIGAWQYYAPTCTARKMNINAVTESWADTVTWPDRPATTTTGATSVTSNKGSSGCGRGFVKANVTEMVKRWADGTLANEGVRFMADVPSDRSYEKRFCSMNVDTSTTYCGTSTQVPYLKVTYDGPPTTPNTFSIVSATTSGSTLYTSTATPEFTVPVTDPEGQTVRARFQVRQGSTVVVDLYSPYVASGSTVVKKSSSLSDGTYTVRALTYDSAGNYSAWTSDKTFVVDTTAPSAPTVACNGGISSGQWYTTRPVGTTACTVTTSGSDVAGYDWKLNNKTQPVVTGSGTRNLGTFTVPVNGTLGITATARDVAGNVSSITEFGFGTGTAGLVTPVADERTSSSVTVRANAPANAAGARIEHKTASAGSSDWVAATEVSLKGSSVGWIGTVTANDSASVTTGDVVWDLSEEDDIDAPSSREVRVCFVYTGVERCTPSRTVNLVASAFGESFAVQEAGPGQVALFTGEFQLDEEDLSIGGFGGDLTIGRSHRSYAGDASPAQSVFGPGWIADLQGPDSGQASLEVSDRTATEAAITLVDPEGESYTYVHSSRTAAAQAVGTYTGDVETGTDNDVLTIEDRSGTKYLTLEEPGGTRTEWKHMGGGSWTVSKVIEPDAGTSTTTFTHNSEGLVTGIYAPAPAGVACNSSAQAVGCRALQLTYSTVGGAKRLSQVDLRIWDPAPNTSGSSEGKPSTSAAMTTKAVAKYGYDATGKLTAAWDPRLGDGSAALKATYEYGTSGARTVLTTATPPGETPWRFAYDSTGRLQTVKRAQPASVGTGDATWSMSYATPLSGTGLPNLTQSAVATWGQPSAPVAGATVFEPSAPGTSDFTYGTTWYWDVEGRVTNTASYGAGAWQIDSIGYDADGNEVWALDEGNRSAALASSGDTAAVAQSLATLTTYDDSGSRIEKVLGPTRTVALKNGDVISGRDWATTVYDDEAASDPDPVPVPGRPVPVAGDPALNLPAEEREGVVDAVGNVHDIIKTRYRYDPVVTGDGDGWITGNATRISQQLGSDWSTTITRYDAQGDLIETRTPQGVAASDGSANDTRSRKVSYYTADASSPIAACRNRPAWVGLECQVGPAGQPSGVSIPVTTTTGYDYLLNPTRVEDASGSTVRSSITAYDQAGRRTLDKVEVANAPAGDAAVGSVTYAYSLTTGAPITVTSGSMSQTTTYDEWGRVLTQSDGTSGPGNSASTTYDAAGRVATFNDGRGTYTYTYDGTDAAGKVERRGLVTKVDLGLAVGPSEMQLASDASGNATVTKYPNGMTAKSEFDSTGAKVSLQYTASDGTEIVGFSNVTDVDSKVRFASSTASDQTYAYDDRGRLTTVQDRQASGCVTRSYTFSLDSNRTALATSGPTSSGGCTAADASTVSASFDAADRKTTSGYTYDALGRTRTIGKLDTDQAGEALAGDLTVAYFGNDMVKSLTQATPSDDGSAGVSRSTAYSLDPSRRISTTETSVGGAAALERTVTHYSDESDSASWVDQQSRTSATGAWTSSGWTRNITGPDGDLLMIQPSTGSAKIQIANLHGDVVSQLDNVTGFAGFDSYSEMSEYGLPVAAGSSLGQGYEWLGTKRRSGGAVGGLTLMGARLYNPSTGRFLSMDPVFGGNDNTYTYPVDPINQFDLDGLAKKTKWAWKKTIKLSKKQAKKVVKILKKVSKGAKWVRRALKFLPGPQANAIVVLISILRPFVKAIANEIKAKTTRRGVKITFGMRKYKKKYGSWGRKFLRWPKYSIRPR